MTTCATCCKPFEPSRPNRLTCSESCRREHERLHRQAYDARPERVRIRLAREKAARVANPIIRNCKGCSEPFRRTRGNLYCERCKAEAAKPPTPRNCKHCEAPFNPVNAIQVYCSRTCKSRKMESRRQRADRPQPQPQPIRVTCEHCNGPIAQPAPKRKFCSSACRKAAHMAKFESVPLDYEGEIIVAPLDEAPKRLALARIVDRYNCTGYFEHGRTRPAWVNEKDKRASR